VLLIGKGRGSWYDEKERVTVSQHEYRTAYDSLIRTGKPKLLAFVRHDVVTVLKERAKSETKPGSDSTLDDPSFTTAFLREVRREDETQKATAGEGSYPAANWLTEFATFRELIEGLRSSLRIRGPLPKVALLETLRHELARNLRMTMTSFDNNPFYNHFWLDRLRREVRIELRQRFEDQIWLQFDQVKSLFAYSLLAPAPEAFVRSALNEAILSGGLLDYDTDRGRFVPSGLLQSIYKLRDELDMYASRYGSVLDYRSDLMRLWDEARAGKRGASVPVFRLASVFGLHDSEQNVVRLLVAILRHLYGHTLSIEVMYRPMSPIVGEDERIKRERVSEDQMQDWLVKDSWRLRVGTTDVSEDQRRDMEAALEKIKELVGEDKLEETLQRIIQGDDEAPN
jgi:hypothetical protein